MKVLYRIAKTKQRLSYASGWLGIFGVPLLIVDLLQKKLSLIGINFSFIFLLIISAILLITVGYVSEKIGLIKAEANWSWTQQEEMQKSLKK